MKFVYALSRNSHSMEVVNEEQPESVLVSFAYPSILRRLAYRPELLMVDSGAFTAWNAGQEVRLAEYYEFARRVRQRHPGAVFINLDVIPGEKGRTSTASERDEAIQASLRNASRLREAGLHVAEVYHQDEPASYLDHLTQRLEVVAGGDSGEESPLLCISPRNDLHEKKRVAWLRRVLAHLLKRYDPQDLPRMHGLAATSPRALRAFPFYSADSSTWMLAVRFGQYTDERGRSQKDTGGIVPSTRPPLAQKHLMRKSIRNTQRLERRATRLWEKRGVTFDS